MESNKKEGVSVKEIEQFAKKHSIEVFLCISFVLACFFSFAFWGTGWSMVFASAGGIIGVFLPGKIEFVAKSICHFIFKQERVTQIILGAVLLIISIFLAPLIFLMIGLHGGQHITHIAMEIANMHKK